MTDDSETTPTRRFGMRAGPKTTYSITRKPDGAKQDGKRPVRVVVVGTELELQANGQTLRVSKADGRRLLAALLETLG